MSNKYLSAFWIILFTVLLFSLPLSAATYDFQTDIKTDSYYVETAAATTNATLVLSKAIYDDDTATIDVASDLSTDTPTYVSYNTTTRATVFDGLTANTSRTLEVSYDIAALTGSTAINNIIGMTQWWWLLAIIALPFAGILAIFTNRD